MLATTAMVTSCGKLPVHGTIAGRWRIDRQLHLQCVHCSAEWVTRVSLRVSLRALLAQWQVAKGGRAPHTHKAGRVAAICRLPQSDRRAVTSNLGTHDKSSLQQSNPQVSDDWKAASCQANDAVVTSTGLSPRNYLSTKRFHTISLILHF